MKHTTKRKIAKEIIIFFTIVALILFSWSIFWAVNKINVKRMKKLEKQVITLNKHIDSLQKINVLVLNENLLPPPPPKQLSKNKEKLEDEVSLIYSKLYTTNQINENAKWLSIALFIMVYPLRFLILLVLWAIKILKMK